MPRNFVATVKESLGECPFLVHLEPYDRTATAGHTVVLRMQPSATLEDARALANVLNTQVQETSLEDLDYPTKLAKLADL